MDNLVELMRPEMVVEAKSPGMNQEIPWLEAVLRKNSIYVRSLLGFLAVAVIVAYYLPPLTRSDVYNNDMCEHLSWYHAAKNPALFRDDIMRTYFTAMCPLGYKALFTSICAYVDPQTLGEVLSLVLGAGSTLLAYKLGEAVTSGTVAGGISAVLLLLFGHAFGLGQFVKVFEGGLQRAFALPVFLLGTWGLLRGKRWVVCIALVLGALFFPPACVVLALFSVLVTGFELLRIRPLSSPVLRSALIIPGAAIFCAALLFLTKALAAHEVHWTVYTLKEAMKMPEYYAGGIWNITCDKPILYPKLTDYLTKAITVPQPVLLLLAVLIFLWRTPAHRSKPLLLVVSALASWVTAYALLFNLYEPSRYISYPLMTLWLLITPCLALEGLSLADKCLKARLLRWMQAGAIAKTGFTVAFVLVIAIVAAYVTVVRIQRGEGGMMGTAPPDVYRFLKSLPEDTKIAAHPLDANDIPMRCQRSVLAFDKAMFPYHREFYEQMKARVVATWTAMYATNYDDILALKHFYGAGVLVINKKRYVGDSFTEKPFDMVLSACRKGLQGSTPLVLHLPKEAVLFEEGTFIIVDLDALDRLQSSKTLIQKLRASGG